MDFVIQAIAEHKSSDAYLTAFDAELYYRHQNPTIMRAQKFVYDIMGRKVPDIWSSNNKIPSRYYFYFVTQAVQFLLGNGVTFSNPKTKERLGKNIDYLLQKTAITALNGGVAFDFWNNDHIEVFSILEFKPLPDEENGSLRGGIRFWQIDDGKPLRATLYEEDGYTEYIKRKNEEMQILQEKRDYIQIVAQSAAGGTEIYNGGNYPSFPIVPLYNVNHQSEIVGSKETIDAYDLMASALINNVDDADIIYWVIKNAGGMNEIDDQRFVERLKTLHTVHLEGEEEVDQHQVNVPFEASETALNRLRSQLFDDFMALDVKQISSGAATATEIKAAYEPLNSKTDLFEYQVTEFIEGILKLVGIDDTPTYTRSLIVNQQEAIQNVLSAAEYLDSNYITRKILDILGDQDKADDVIARKIAEDMGRFSDDNDSDETGG